MTTDATPRDDTMDELDVLACEYEKRPRDAPSFFDLQHAIRSVRREAGALIVDFDLTFADAVEQLVSAERRCCPTIGWDLATVPAPRLRIRAQPAQLDIFEQFLAPSTPPQRGNA